jgi:type IV secretion system protein VirB2
MNLNTDTATTARFQSTLSALCAAAAFAAMLVVPETALAAPGGGFAETDDKVTGFLDNIRGLLNIASAVVVTIAIIFAGYQIAFAHKRISDVAPILIGGFLIGAAAQIANMLIGDGGEHAVAALVSLSLGHA